MSVYIGIWSGSLESVPSWAKICNGDNGTPDLRDYFVRGAVDASNVNTTGGSASYSHSHSLVTSNFAHSHYLSSSGTVASQVLHGHGGLDSHRGRIQAGSSKVGFTESHSHTTNSPTTSHSHTTDSDTIPLPLYYALYFIALPLSQLGALESKSIIMWSGSPTLLPSGWVLCDGANGTPDLQGKFILGAETDLGTVGGAKKHTHSVMGLGVHTHSASTAPAQTHSHTVTSSTEGTGAIRSGLDATAEGTIPAHTHDVTAKSGSHTHSLSETYDDYDDYPPFYNLCYVMRV